MPRLDTGNRLQFGGDLLAGRLLQAEPAFSISSHTVRMHDSGRFDDPLFDNARGPHASPATTARLYRQVIMRNPHVVETLSDQCNRRPSKVEASWGSMPCFEEAQCHFHNSRGAVHLSAYASGQAHTLPGNAFAKLYG